MTTFTRPESNAVAPLDRRPAREEPPVHWPLSAPAHDGGMSLLGAVSRRQSRRSFSRDALTGQQLSNLLWVAAGVNRPELGGRTAPSAMNAQEVRLYVALPQGLYRYSPTAHALDLVLARDVRAVTGYQDFVEDAALDLIYVADHNRMRLVPGRQREPYAFAAAGAVAQNVYLYCASVGLATVLRALFDHRALSEAMGLGADEQLMLTQTVGVPKPGGAA